MKISKAMHRKVKIKSLAHGDTFHFPLSEIVYMKISLKFVDCPILDDGTIAVALDSGIVSEFHPDSEIYQVEVKARVK